MKEKKIEIEREKNTNHKTKTKKMAKIPARPPSERRSSEYEGHDIMCWLMRKC